MWFSAIATDCDGTLATEGVVSGKAVSALEQVRASGRFVIVLTGRLLPDLQNVCPRFDLFDLVVAENGALLHTPATGSSRLLGPPLSESFREQLRDSHVAPLSLGEVIAATLAPAEKTVRQLIEARGEELDIIRNKDAVMVLPKGIDKRSGLVAASEALQIHPDNILGFGDAENDITFMEICGCCVAVANALPEVRARADIVSPFENGAGVVDAIQKMLVGAL